MSSPRLRALVLTAGFGTRLRPLTFFLPKALLPICGEAVAGHTLRQLAGAGCESAVLNLHHLGDAVSDHFGPEAHGMPIAYSPEAEIQGTLGALYPLRDHLVEADLVLLINGDTLCSWPLKTMIRHHLRSQADVTMLLHRKSPREALGGPVGVDARNRVVRLRDSEPVGEVHRRHLFMGAHILAPRLLESVEEKPADIVGDLYIPLLREKGRIQGVVTARRWHDLGTPERYLAASLDWARSRRLPGFRSRGVVSSLAEVDESATLHRAVVEAGAAVRAEARIGRSVILSGAIVARGCTVRSSVIGPDVELPPAASIEHRLVTRVRSGVQLAARDSVMGDLVYTPLGQD